MHPTYNNNKRALLQVLFLSIVVVCALFMWQGTKGLSLWDEGYFWYGVQRVMQGEVPIRDFMAYDPGRYYWSAAFMGLLNNHGMVVLRASVAAFQALGLFVGLWLIARNGKRQNIFYLLLCAITLSAWMWSYFKVTDFALSIFLIGVLVFWIGNPTSRNYFLSGLCIGLAAFFGRNHGVYGIVGSIAVMVWLNFGQGEKTGFVKGLALWTGGVIVGFTPILLMVLLVPGFAAAFLESIRFLFEIKGTNLALPVPWPWMLDLVSPPLIATIQAVLVGLFFIGIVAFGVLSLVWVVWQKIRSKDVSPVLVASSFLALPYAHYAYSRADVWHLALGIFPLLIGCLSLLAPKSAKIKYSLAIALCMASLWSTYDLQPGWQCRPSNQCVTLDISGSSLQVEPSVARDIELLRKLAAQYSPDGQNFIAAPFWPGAYALLERKSPMWEIYALFPRSQSFEQDEIERIKLAKPRFALVVNIPVDPELRFPNSHPLIYKYIQDNFELVPDPSYVFYQIYRAKE